MIEGSVDLLSFNRACGWASDLENTGVKLTVRAYSGNTVIASCTANSARQDLESFGDQGRFAFELHYPAVEDIHSLRIVAESESAGRILPVIKLQPASYGYQSFSDQIGDSDSFTKLKCLGLPLKMDGLSVLDLGCNEGFFCIDAHNRGAAQVTGIDANPGYIERAVRRDPKTRYICASWWDIPEQKYDLIYFLSAIHYEPEQKRLLDKLASHLTSNGLLILECGLAPGQEQQSWLAIERSDGVFRYPTRQYLTNTLLERYYPRFYGKSVSQAGDPIDRYVFHACLRQPMVIFLTGQTLAGKTMLANLLADNAKVVHFSIDLWLWQISVASLPLPKRNPVYELIRKKLNPQAVGDFIDSLDEHISGHFAEALFLALPLDCECVILEGYALQKPAIADALAARLQAAKTRLWRLERQN